ncbi:MAG: pseudouridine synthase [Prevotellaceae bacterium]|jgi:23S rRNA pseudouridine2605 synthase|nr:pseudouridine synthase [Prevotellaceae bacterium]
MEQENDFTPSGSSDAPNGNEQGNERTRRPRINSGQNRRQDFNPNFDFHRHPRNDYSREDRPYSNDGNHPYHSERRPYNSDGNRPYNSERRPYNSDGNRPYNSERRPYNNDGNRPYNSERRPYNSDGNRPYNSERRPYNSDGNRSYNSERRPYNSDGNRPYNSEHHSYNNDGNRPYNSERRPYNSDGNRSYNSERRPYNNGGNRPYNSERRPYNSGGNRPYNSGRKPFDRGNNSVGRSYEDRDYDPNDKYSQKKQIEYKKQFVDFTQPMRLNKFMANSGICSRREADEYILAGVIKVNGEPATELGVKIIPATDKVLFHDQLVQVEKKVYILLNKPKNCVTTSDDPQERCTVLDLVKGACPERIYPVGRLDRNTTGVILITNDGDLTSKLTHPKYDKKKVYQVTLNKALQPSDMQQLADGITLEDGEIKADAISYIVDGSEKQIGIEIHSGRNRIVRRMFEHLGYHIARLDRVYFAGLTKKNLPRGKWRYLSESEVNMLKMSN